MSRLSHLGAKHDDDRRSLNAGAAVGAVFAAVAEALARGKVVAVTGFGRFTREVRPARQGRQGTEGGVELPFNQELHEYLSRAAALCEVVWLAREAGRKSRT